MARFELDEIEQKKANVFKQWHRKCKPHDEAQHAPYKYIFMPTSIGNVVSIVCPYCGKKRDITNVDNW